MQRKAVYRDFDDDLEEEEEGDIRLQPAHQYVGGVRARHGHEVAPPEIYSDQWRGEHLKEKLVPAVSKTLCDHSTAFTQISWSEEFVDVQCTVQFDPETNELQLQIIRDDQIRRWRKPYKATDLRSFLDSCFIVFRHAFVELESRKKPTLPNSDGDIPVLQQVLNFHERVCPVFNNCDELMTTFRGLFREHEAIINGFVDEKLPKKARFNRCIGRFIEYLSSKK